MNLKTTFSTRQQIYFLQTIRYLIPFVWQLRFFFRNGRATHKYSKDLLAETCANKHPSYVLHIAVHRDGNHGYRCKRVAFLQITQHTLESSDILTLIITSNISMLHYVIFSTPLFPHHSQDQIFSLAPYSQTPPVFVPPSM